MGILKKVLSYVNQQVVVVETGLKLKKLITKSQMREVFYYYNTKNLPKEPSKYGDFFGVAKEVKD